MRISGSREAAVTPVSKLINPKEATMANTIDALAIDLSDLEIADVEILAQQGGRGIPEFAASCGTNCCAANACSCTTSPTRPTLENSVEA